MGYQGQDIQENKRTGPDREMRGRVKSTELRPQGACFVWIITVARQSMGEMQGSGKTGGYEGKSTSRDMRTGVRESLP